jgi:hypothetical protein
MRLGGRRFFLSLTILAAASVCLALGITLPILKLTRFAFWETEHSLLSTVGVLLRDGQTFLGGVVLLFSILLPVTSRPCRRPRSCASTGGCGHSSGSANGRCMTCWCSR